MAWKEVATTAIDIKKEKGKHFVGTYTGKQEITTKIGPQTIWRFMDEDEQPFGIYSFTNLGRAMNNVAVGKLCRVTYMGTQKVKTKYGEKDVHQVSVEVDDTANGSSEDVEVDDSEEGESAEVGE